MAAIEPDEKAFDLEVPRDVAHQIKNIAQEYPGLWKWVLEDLCRIYKLSWVPGTNRADSLAPILEGRRWVGLALLQIQANPVDPAPEPNNGPPAQMTMTERVRRRNSRNS
jgi:hypothetical protein